jgi:histidinol dehydrogenase
MEITMLTPVSASEVSLEIKDAVDPQALEQAKAIVGELRRTDGTVDSAKLMEVAKRLGDVPADSASGAYLVSKESCKAAFEALSDDERTSLTNIHDRVKTFAEAQRSSVRDMERPIPGGVAGHTVSPCRGACVDY